MMRHFTATAFILDSKGRTLLLMHKKLERWMPPGGHVDENETPEDAAVRECKEETGLDVEIVTTNDRDMFEGCAHEGRMLLPPAFMLLENIPARGDQPAHQHMDFVFVVRPVDESQTLALAEEEGAELKWFDRDDIAALDERTEIFGNVKNYLLGALSPK